MIFKSFNPLFCRGWKDAESSKKWPRKIHPKKRQRPRGFGLVWETPARKGAGSPKEPLGPSSSQLGPTGARPCCRSATTPRAEAGQKGVLGICWQNVRGCWNVLKRCGAAGCISFGKILGETFISHHFPPRKNPNCIILFSQVWKS